MQNLPGVPIGRRLRLVATVAVSAIVLATIGVLASVKPTAGPAPVPTPVPTAVPTVSGPYGSINADTKANIRVGPEGTLAHRFQASTSSTLLSVRFSQRGGPIYGGTGGTLRISVRADDGSGHAAKAMLSSLIYNPGNADGSWTTYLDLPFPSPAAITKGTTYYIVFDNTDPDPTTNYISVNELFIYGKILSPRQPILTDSGYAVLLNGVVQGEYTADMDLTYADGAHDGLGYIGALIALYGVVSGPNDMVREHFTVSGIARSVSSASVRVRRTSGSSPLVVTLETDAGAVVESVSVPAASIDVSAPGGDDGGAVWVSAIFGATHILGTGATYNLRLSTAADTEYTTVPVLEGTRGGLRVRCLPRWRRPAHDERRGLDKPLSGWFRGHAVLLPIGGPDGAQTHHGRAFPAPEPTGPIVPGTDPGRWSRLNLIMKIARTDRAVPQHSPLQRSSSVPIEAPLRRPPADPPPWRPWHPDPRRVSRPRPHVLSSRAPRGARPYDGRRAWLQPPA